MEKLLMAAAAVLALSGCEVQFPVTNSERGCVMLAETEANAESCRKLKASFTSDLATPWDTKNLVGCALAAGLYHRDEGRRDSDREIFGVPRDIFAVMWKGCGMLIYDFSEKDMDSILEQSGLNR